MAKRKTKGIWLLAAISMVAVAAVAVVGLNGSTPSVPDLLAHATQLSRGVEFSNWFTDMTAYRWRTDTKFVTWKAQQLVETDIQTGVTSPVRFLGIQPTFEPASVSPNGKYVLYNSSRVRWGPNSYNCTIDHSAPGADAVQAAFLPQVSTDEAGLWEQIWRPDSSGTISLKYTYNRPPAAGVAARWYYGEPTVSISLAFRPVSIAVPNSPSAALFTPKRYVKQACSISGTIFSFPSRSLQMFASWGGIVGVKPSGVVVVQDAGLDKSVSNPSTSSETECRDSYYVLEVTPNSTPTIVNRLRVRAPQDPNDPQIGYYGHPLLSPKGDKLLYFSTGYSISSRNLSLAYLYALARRLFPFGHRTGSSGSIYKYEMNIWIGGLDMGKPRLIGRLTSPTDLTNVPNAQWMPDGKRISFLYNGNMYAVPAE